MESETTWESIFREDTDFVFFFDFLASAGAPGDPRTKDSENYFYIFYGMPEHVMPEHEMPDAGCRVSCYHVVTDFPSHDNPRSGPAGPEPKFFVKFIFPPEPDGRIRRKKLHTGHRSP